MSDVSPDTPKVKEFYDLPIELIGEIVEKSELRQQLILRKVCKQLRDVVDEQKISPYKTIDISCEDTEILCRYNYQDVVYALRIPRDHNGKVVHGDDYIGVACNDLNVALGNPKLVLSHFRFFYRSYEESVPSLEFQTLVSFLESLSHKVSVRSVDIDAPEIDATIRILSCLNPKILKTIETHRFKMSSSWSLTGSIEEKLDELAEMEQWKQAEELCSPHPFSLFKPEHYASFKRINFKEFAYDSGALEKYKSIFLAPSSKTILISIERRDEFEVDEFVELPGTPAAQIEPNSVVRHFDIPNSKGYLEYHFLIGMREMTITKKSR